MIALLMLVAALQSPPDAPRPPGVILATRDSAGDTEGARRQTIRVVGYRPPPGGVPAAQQTALFAVDFDGYSAGRCWDHLPSQERAELDAARARFNARSPAEPAPVLDQIFQSAFTRGQIEARAERPDPDPRPEQCEAMRENAPIALADVSSDLAAFEAVLPPPLRRPALTEAEVTAEGRRLGRLAVLQPLCAAAGRPVEGDLEAPDLEALEADFMARVLASGWSWAAGRTALDEGAEGARAEAEREGRCR